MQRWRLSRPTARAVMSASADKKARIKTLAAEISSKYPVQEMSVLQASQQMESETPPVLVDTRNSEEQQVSMLPQAITKVDFEQRKAEYEGRCVVCYCTVGLRSGAYAQQLCKEGFDAYNLTGSIMAWTQEGLPLVDGSDGTSETKRVHAYAQRWALQGDAYTHVIYPSPHARMALDAVIGIFGRK